MSKKTNDQNVLPEGKVLTTSVSRIVAKFGMIFAAIGLTIGILVMVFLNLGLHEMLFGAESAATEIVAHNASGEEGGDSGEGEPEPATGIQAILDEYNVKFRSDAMDYPYDGEEHKVVVDEATVALLASKGVSVTYANNAHTDAGTYTALAIFSAEGCEPVIMEAELKISKNYTYINGITFESALVEYKEGFTHEIVVNGDIPKGVEVTYAFNKAEEPGVYNATVILYGKNYTTEELHATLTVVDLTKLVRFDDIDEEKNAILFTYDKNEHTVELNTSAVLPEIVEKRNFKVTYDVNTFIDAGEYVVTATVSADKFTTFTVPVTVIVEQGDMENVYGLSYGIEELEYDGFVKAVDIDYSRFEDGADFLTYVIKYYSVSGEGESEVLTEIDPADVCNPGKYRAVIEITDTTGNCKNHTGDTVINYDFEIAKRNVIWLYTIENVETRYSRVTVKYEDGTEEKVGKVNNLVMTFDATMLHNTITAQPLVVTFTYGEKSVVVTFTFEKEKILDKDNNLVETDKDIVVSTYELNGEVITEEHEYNNVVFVIPIDFVDQGTYVLDVVVEGNDYDADAILNPRMFIDYAALNGITVKNNQIVIANGTFQTPKFSGASKNATLEVYDKKGNLVEGFKYFGFHTAKLVFTDGNYQTTKTVRYIVMFNPLIALAGLVVGMLLGLLVGLLTSGFWIKKEKSSRNLFKAPSAIVANARGGILCESYAKFEGSGCTGRLYLSAKSIEFYADDYKALKDNFLIDIDDVRNVDAIAPNKIQIYAKKENYVFTVPDGTAAEWAHEIVHA